MRTVKIAELKDHLSEYLRNVEAGAEIVVSDRDRPIAKIVPHNRGRARIRIVPPSRRFKDFRRKRHAPTRWKKSSTELLLEERQQR